MKKAGLATCFIDNYGACLQAYALQTKIEECGYQTEIINFREPRGYRKGTSLKHTLFYRPFFVKLLGIYNKKYTGAFARNVHCENFRRKYLKLSEPYCTMEELYQAKMDYDAYVCGSDQIWNPLFYGGNNKAYLLDFAPPGKKKVSYAPSIGLGRFPEEYKEEFKKLLGTFHALSVRELAGKEIINDVGYEATVVLDPTLLVESDEWEKILKPVKVRDPYIFCYLFGDRPYIGAVVEEFAKRTGLKVVCMPFTKREEESDYVKIYDAGPQEFLWLIKNAELVLTDSFHATAFSANFNTPFYSLLRNTDKDEINMNSRIFSILDLLGLQDRIIASEKEIPNEEKMGIDFTEANRRLQEKRREDFGFLKEALGG